MKLVGVEGIDGSGKTSLVTAVTAALPCACTGIQVATHREPSAGPIGRLFRQLSTDDGHSPTTLALLSAADRHDQQTALAQLGADLVISDRYYLSGLAYHAAEGVDQLFYQWLNDRVRRPDLYLFLDIDPVTAYARRRSLPSTPHDRWERKAITALLPAAYERALRLVEDTEDATVARLDAMQPPLTVMTQALSALAPLLARITGDAHGGAHRTS